MKKTYSTLMGKLATGVLLALGTIFVTGCAKDAKQDLVEDTGEGTRVVVRVQGINNQGGPALKGKAGAATGAASASNAKLIEGSGFDVFVSQNSKIATQSNLGATKRRSSLSASNGARAEAMEDGIAYRVFLRKEGETSLISEPFTSGTVGSIPVEKGASYEWFALSFNNSDEVAAGTDGSVEVGSISNGVLYAKGEFEVANTDGDVVVPLDITFDPRLTRVAVELNTMGMFASAASADVTVEGVYAAPDAIDVLTGDFDGNTDAALTLDFDDFEIVEGSDGQRRIAMAYVAANADGAITVSASDLTITLDTDATRNFEGILTQEFTPEPGMEQHIVLNFLESPLIRGDVSWARSNLYYADDFNPYRFYHTNPRTNDPNSYFSFKGHLPRQLASSSSSSQIDPCALVYPVGRWKTPTQAELGTLTSTQGLLSNVVGGLLATLGLGATPGMQYQTGEYIQLNPAAGGGRPATTGQNDAYNDATNVLRFNYNGLMQNVGLVELIELNLGNTYGAQAAFWTSESVTDANLGGLLGGVLDLGAWSFVGRDTQTLLGRRVYGTQSLGVLNIELLGAVDVVRSSLMNVRCTRDTGWDPTEAGYDPYEGIPAL